MLQSVKLRDLESVFGGRFSVTFPDLCNSIATCFCVCNNLHTSYIYLPI